MRGGGDPKPSVCIISKPAIPFLKTRKESTDIISGLVAAPLDVQQLRGNVIYKFEERPQITGILPFWWVWGSL